MRRQAALGLLLAACPCSACNDRSIPGDPEPLVARPLPTTPPDWHRVAFVAGSKLAMPPDAIVARPQGIDSRVLDVRGEGYALMLDDDGGFTGTTTDRIAGRRARRHISQEKLCRRATYEIELPTRTDYTKFCDTSGKRCRPAAGKITVSAICASRSACRTTDAILTTIHFAPPPYPALPAAAPDWQPPPGKLCDAG